VIFTQQAVIVIANNRVLRHGTLVRRKGTLTPSYRINSGAKAALLLEVLLEQSTVVSPRTHIHSKATTQQTPQLSFCVRKQTTLQTLHLYLPYSRRNGISLQAIRHTRRPNSNSSSRSAPGPTANTSQAILRTRRP
jgi:hypothetical protein